jgi:hypothetical protein
MSIFSVLICVVSFALRPLVSLNIHNQCKDINLTSPAYFIHGGEWRAALDQEIGVNAIMRNCIEFDSGQDILEGVLMYRIQRQHIESDKFIQDESKSVQLLVAWHVEHTKELHVCTLLVEHDNELDESNLRELHQKYWHLLETWIKSIENEWTLNDTTMLKTTVEAMNEYYRWDVFTSEEHITNNSFWRWKGKNKKPLWIDRARWVAIMLVIFSMFTRTISLTLYKPMIITVKNQHPDIKLVSPVYFCNCGSHYEYSVKKMGCTATMSFRLGFDQAEPGGIFTYKMKRKKDEKSIK